MITITLAGTSTSTNTKTNISIDITMNSVTHLGTDISVLFNISTLRIVI